MLIGSLFSGIGGLELGLERAGLGEVAWQVEIDPWCRRVLAKHWPGAVQHEDVTKVGRTELAPVDVICGGFPCQDLSFAGQGAGLDGARSGLWFEYLRIVRELRPRLVIVENVAALAHRGLGVVLGGLAAAGYDAEWACVAASDVGAPHRRRRLFIVAHTRHDGREGRPERDGEPLRPGQQAPQGRDALRRDAPVADADGEQSERVGAAPGVRATPGAAEGDGAERERHGDAAGRGGAALADAAQPRLEGHGRPVGGERASRSAGGDRSAQPGVGRGFDGLSAGVDAARRAAGPWPSRPGEPQHAWEPPRTARGQHERAARLHALGNAVVPAVAYAVGLWAMAIAMPPPGDTDPGA